jgi:hypothetical protein
MGISTFTSKESAPFYAGYLADWQCFGDLGYAVLRLATILEQQ